MAKKKTATSTTLPRPPIVTIMGHVDHGKTTLLDAIRKTHVAAGEAGGITQHVGAYQTRFHGQPITFIDTPGHAAFNKMRSRGAQVTDIVILVVAANDGVQPQTVESINHIKAANVPYIVAINKVDLPDISIKKVKSELSEHEVFVEGFGGQVPVVEISAKTGQGLDQLLDMILLVGEMAELKADPKSPLSAVIIESNLDKHQGPLATVIVKQGSLKTQGTVYLGDEAVKIRTLIDDTGKTIKVAGPSQPVLVLGFKVVPPVGEVLLDHPVAPPPFEAVAPVPRKLKKVVAEGEVEAEPEPEKPHFNLILKADTAGTLEAILNSVMQPEITLIDSGVGPIDEADVLLALDTKAVIIGFNIPVTTSAQRLADLEKVRIKTFGIIYELLEFLEDKILELLEPTIHEEEMGVAQVMQVFDIRDIKIAGSKVISGRIQKNDRVHLVHRDKIVTDSQITSVKQGKTDLKTAKAGEECGIVIDRPFDFRTGDMIKSYRIIEK